MVKLNKQEQGRSMVEMLGVLAIIGVLSIAGIAGYTAAMNQHKANELLNEASKRAVVIAAQIASDRTPNIGEFGDNKVGSATFSDPQVGATTFKMSLSGVDKNVSDQMESILGDDGYMAIVDNCTGDTCTLSLHFNKDLKKGGINTTEEYSQEGQESGTTPTETPFVFDYSCMMDDDSNSCKTKCEALNAKWYGDTGACCKTKDDSSACCDALGNGIYSSVDKKCCTSNTLDSEGHCIICSNGVKTNEQCCKDESENNRWQNNSCCADGKDVSTKQYTISCCASHGTQTPVSNSCCDVEKGIDLITGKVNTDCCNANLQGYPLEVVGGKCCMDYQDGNGYVSFSDGSPC